jgi:hypothetical protein
LESDVLSLSVQMIDLSITLDHFWMFPENQVESIHRRVRKNVFGYCILRHLVTNYFYLFRAPIEIQQRYSALFDIQITGVRQLGEGLPKEPPANV